ncbi:hypothetical protein [Butyrivibrio sp. MC2013]|uniref:hypothetical protein n=1 Tax=Butyrivibrio sp. MC2013 TaxID=1280686 RepID=UPI0018C94660|nr:hypothetical protein [Butyrivibrio sp. MC2013]
MEQAMLKQSQRLVATYGKRDIPKTSVEKLIDSDFDVNISDAATKRKSNTIGFAV